MLTVRDAETPLSGSTVNSLVTLHLSNIIGLKCENRLPCDFFLAETQLCYQGLYHFRKNTQFPWLFGQFARKSEEIFSLWKILSHGKLAGILRCKRVETIIHFRKTMMIIHWWLWWSSIKRWPTIVLLLKII